MPGINHVGEQQSNIASRRTSASASGPDDALMT